MDAFIKKCGIFRKIKTYVTTIINKKRFSEKRKVAFKNSTVFILDFYIYIYMINLFGLMFWPGVPEL